MEQPAIKRLTQILIVLAAMVVAIVLVVQTDSSTFPPPFDMLTFLDTQVATQEDGKDVRCWSSVCKLQMFLTGAVIGEDAITVRIESHMQLIESLWEQGRDEHPHASMISSDTVKQLLDRRFPHQQIRTGVQFDLGSNLNPINIVQDAMQDYSDTVEPWRLLQTWASRHTDKNGRLTLTPQFDRDALHALHGFLLKYDLAIFRHARRIAEENKASRVDASAMSEAFDLESKLQR